MSMISLLKWEMFRKHFKTPMFAPNIKKYNTAHDLSNNFEK